MQQIRAGGIAGRYAPHSNAKKPPSVLPRKAPLGLENTGSAPAVTALDYREAAAGVPAGWYLDPDDDDYAERMEAALGVRDRITAPPVRTWAAMDASGVTPLGRYVIDALPADLDAKADELGSRAIAIYAVACRIGRLARDGHAEDAVAYTALLASALEIMDDDRLTATDTARRGFRAGRESA